MPVCTVPGKEFGVEEALVPAIANMLDEVRGVALLRCLKAEADRDKIKRVFWQVLELGKAGAREAWQAFTGSASARP